MHHIASDKSIKSGYTKQYKEIFDKGGMKLSDKANQIKLLNHKGRHTNTYKKYVLDKLNKGVSTLENSMKNGAKPKPKEYKKAITKVLKKLSRELRKNPRLPYIK